MTHRSYDSDTREIDGVTYRVEWVADDSMGPPWKEHDGHGLVSEWTRRGKAPGERMLCEDRGQYRYYDVAGSLVIARRDGWGPPAAPGETARQQAAAAVEADYQRLRGWCNNEWQWCGVVVTGPTGDTASLWGLESDAGEYFEDVIRDLVAELQGAADKAWIERRAPRVTVWHGDGLSLFYLIDGEEVVDTFRTRADADEALGVLVAGRRG